MISWKATGHNDHYMINMGGQRLMTGGNWPLTSLYWQHCYYKNEVTNHMSPERSPTLILINNAILSKINLD